MRTAQEFSRFALGQCRAAFEFRHQSWFDSEIFDLLREHQAVVYRRTDNDLEIPFTSTATGLSAVASA